MKIKMTDTIESNCKKVYASLLSVKEAENLKTCTKEGIFIMKDDYMEVHGVITEDHKVHPTYYIDAGLESPCVDFKGKGLDGSKVETRTISMNTGCIIS